MEQLKNIDSIHYIIQKADYGRSKELVIRVRLNGQELGVRQFLRPDDDFFCVFDRLMQKATEDIKQLVYVKNNEIGR